jgi:hypothetical protein
MRQSFAQETDAPMRLFAQPGIAIPDAAGHERIMVAGNDEDGTRTLRTFENGEDACRVRPRNAVVVEDVAGDQNEIGTEFGSFLAELLERREPRLADPAASALIESSDADSQVKIRGMQESNHRAASVRRLNRAVIGIVRAFDEKGKRRAKAGVLGFEPKRVLLATPDFPIVCVDNSLTLKDFSHAACCTVWR